MALRDLLRRLGIGRGEVKRQGVRRSRDHSFERPPDTPTVRVPAAMSPEPAASPLPQPNPAPPAPTEITAPPPPPRAAPVAPPRPAAPQTLAAQPAPAAPDLGGATQYVSVGPARGTLVGVLAGIDGPLEGQLFKIHDGDNSLGREGGDVQMPSRRISRHHARIQHQEGVFVIEANAEVMDRNPTFLNDDEIDAEALSDGDTIKLGDCTFRFRTI